MRDPGNEVAVAICSLFTKYGLVKIRRGNSQSSDLKGSVRSLINLVSEKLAQMDGKQLKLPSRTGVLSFLTTSS